jgi:hypothetical protein
MYNLKSYIVRLIPLKSLGWTRGFSGDPAAGLRAA